MPATVTDLPAELISRVLEFLSGAWPTTFEWGNMYTPGSQVALDKRETGNCARVCRYWSSIVRRWLFMELCLRTEDDADKLISFAMFPHAPDLSIAQHIITIKIIQKMSDSPWAQRIFIHKKAFLNVTQIKLELQGDPTPVDPHRKVISPVRSIFPQFPKAMPPSMLTFPTAGSCKAQHIAFRNFGDLNAFMRSVRQLNYKSWPADSREPTLPRNWEFERCLLSDVTSPASVRPILFRGLGATLRLIDCPRPWTFLRAVFPGTRTKMRYNPEKLIWGPVVLEGARDMIEKIMEELVSCCPVYSPAGDGAADMTHTHEGSFHILLAVRGDDLDGGFTIEFRRWCPGSGLGDLEIRMSPSGSLGYISAEVLDPDLLISLSWTKIDNLLADLGRDAPFLTIRRTFSSSIYQLKSPFVTLIEPIQSKMPRLLQLGKLQFIDYDEKNFKYVVVTIEDAPQREEKVKPRDHIPLSEMLPTNPSASTRTA